MAEARRADAAASRGTEPGRTAARARTRLRAPVDEPASKALDAELATRVVGMLDAIPLDKLLRSGDPKHFERFARQLTNGTPYQAQADELASNARLGDVVRSRLAGLAAIAKKEGVGLEELLRHQPAAALDMLIKRDYRGLVATLRASKNAATRAPSKSAERVATTGPGKPESGLAPTRDSQDSRMSHAAARLGITIEEATQLSEAGRTWLLKQQAKEQDELLSPRMDEILARSSSPTLRASDPAKLEGFVLDLTKGTYLEAKTKGLAGGQGLGEHIRSRLALLAEAADTAGIGIDATMRRHPSAVMEYLVDRDSEKLVAALRHEARRIEAGTGEAETVEPPPVWFEAAEPAPAKPKRATADLATPKPATVRPSSTIASPAQWRSAEEALDAQRREVTEFRAGKRKVAQEALAELQVSEQASMMLPRINEVLAKKSVSSLLAADPAQLGDFALQMTQGTHLEAKAKELADSQELGHHVHDMLGELVKRVGAVGVGLEDMMRRHPGAVMDYLIGADFKKLAAALKAEVLAGAWK